MLWLIGDTHFGHENIVRYCNRPFANAHDMDETIIANWNRVVKPEDTVIHLGDFAIAKEERIPEYISRLNGSIVLIMGNHDRRKTVTYWKKRGMMEAAKKPVRALGYIFSHEPENFPDIPNIHGHTHGNVHRGEVSEHGVHICVSCEVINYTPVTIDQLNGKQEER